MLSIKAKKKINKYSNLSLSDSIISVIVVTSNDEDIIIDRLKGINKILLSLKTNYEIIIVDSGSIDETVEKIRVIHSQLPHVRILVLSKNYNTEVALTAGLDSCVGDYAILFNIYTDPTELIHTLVKKVVLQNYDIVFGKYEHDLVKQPPLSSFFLWIMEKLSSHAFYFRQNYSLIINRRAINSIIRIRRKSRNLAYLYTLIGLKKDIIKYQPSKEFTYKLQRESSLQLILDSIDVIISNSFKPMRLVSFLGMSASLLFILYIIGVVLLEVLLKLQLAPQGWISIATVMATMFFILFSLLTLMSEYLIRVVNESRDEPFYFVAEEFDKSIILSKKRRFNVVKK